MIGLFNEGSVVRSYIVKRQVQLSMVLVPLFFGLLSVFAGQDMGWEFLNYHIYNPYSFLEGRLNQDLSAAGFHAYFNPTADIPYYWMIGHLPAMMVGFIMGFVQGLVFIPILGISLVLIERMGGDKSTAIFVSIVGVFSAGFIDQIRGISGDNLTALFQLSAMYLIFSNLGAIKGFKAKALIILIVAGIVSGIGSGLKLTSVTASVAICLALLSLNQPILHRFYTAFIFGVGVLIGLSISAGHWFVEMYMNFGNPLFPQFSSFFPSNLATSIAIADTRFLPQTIIDAVLRPFIFLFDPEKFDGEDWPQIMWPVFYVVFLIWVFFRVVKGQYSQEVRDEIHVDRINFVISYVVIGFIVWMMLFSIYRYQLYFFMLAPLALWVMVNQMSSTRFSKLLVLFFWASIALSLITGLRTMGSNGWSSKAIWSEPMQFQLPSDSSVLLVGEPMAWVSVLLPKSVSIIGVGNSFPASSGHKDKVMSMIEDRDHSYALLPIRDNRWLASVDIANTFLQGSFITGTQAGCDAIQWVLENSRIRAAYIAQPGDHQDLCRLGVREKDGLSFEKEAATLLKQQQDVLSQYGYTLDTSSCEVNDGYVGNKKFEFNVCKLK